MKKKWTAKRDCRGMTTDEIINAILDDRGVEDPLALLYPNEDHFIPFEEMRNIDKAARIILDGIENNKKFLVYYDVDADGISAGTIAVRWLQQKGADVIWTINEGKRHGIEKADPALLATADILWIVDSIETQMYPYETAFRFGVESIVITDHHLVSPLMRKQMERTGRIALISSAMDYPNPALSGSAVTWKLCSYMDWLELEDYSEELVDLAAVGLIADMCDVGVKSPENRYICYKGLNNQINPALKKINGSYQFNSQSVSFGIAPLINASNRMNENEKALQLFLSEDQKEISRLVNDLKECKEEQNYEIMELMPSLEEQAESQIDKKVMFFITNGKKELSGLLANKLMERYQRPIIVLTKKIEVDEETGEVLKYEYTGSCRAIGVKNFKEYVDDTGLVGCGGHELAFGLWLDVEVLDDFKNALEEALADVEFVQEAVVDIQLDAEQLTDEFIKKVKNLNRISGQGWSPISVMISGVKNYQVGEMSGGKHVKLVIGDDNLLFIKWNYFGDWDEFDGEVSVIGGLDSGFFGRTYYRQLIINDYTIQN